MSARCPFSPARERPSCPRSSPGCSRRLPPSAFCSLRCCIPPASRRLRPSGASCIPARRPSASLCCNARSHGSSPLRFTSSAVCYDAARHVSPAAHCGARCFRGADDPARAPARRLRRLFCLQQGLRALRPSDRKANIAKDVENRFRLRLSSPFLPFTAAYCTKRAVSIRTARFFVCTKSQPIHAAHLPRISL